MKIFIEDLWKSIYIASPGAPPEVEMPGEGEDSQGADGECHPVEGGVERAELQTHPLLSLHTGTLSLEHG